MRPMMIDRRGAVEHVAAELEKRILDGEIPPGTALVESRLASEHQLSRNTLREAIRGLVSAGLVRHVPHRGFMVNEVTAEDVRDLYRARETVEIAAARAPLDHLLPLVRPLEEAADRISSAHLDANWGEVFRAHRDFHVTLVSALDCRRLEQFTSQLFTDLRLAMAYVDRQRRPPEQSLEDHDALIEPIRSRDQPALVERVRAHLRTGEKRVLNRLAGASPTTSAETS